ncbi:MAG: C39 family peptidase [Eubacteriales bacterium]
MLKIVRFVILTSAALMTLCALSCSHTAETAALYIDNNKFGEYMRCAASRSFSDGEYGHDILPATCTEGERCSKCGEIFTPPLGHEIVEADCTSPQHCDRCGETFGEALGHEITPLTCTEDSRCTRCGMIFEIAPGHDLTEADCENPSCCKRCGDIIAPALGHDYTEADCTHASYCRRCRAVGESALGHDFAMTEVDDASCTSDGTEVYTCSRCDYSFTLPIMSEGHDYSGGDICPVCGMTRTFIAADVLYQGEEYPNGCESVTAVMALRHIGVNISAGSFIEKFLDKASKPDYDAKKPTAQSPYDYYIGDPTSDDGYYCFAPVVVKAVNKLSSAHAEFINTMTLEQLCKKYVKNGTPVVIWATKSMNTLKMSQASWYLKKSGKKYQLIANLHCMLLTGWDDDYFYFNDPLTGTVFYDRTASESAFKSLNSQAVVITAVKKTLD